MEAVGDGLDGGRRARSLTGCQAVVIGSAMRRGRVLPEVRAFVKARKTELQALPVAAASFAGKLDPAKLDRMSRLMVKPVGTPPGDQRDWRAIEAWARELSRGLDAAELPGRAGVH